MDFNLSTLMGFGYSNTVICLKVTCQPDNQVYDDIYSNNGYYFIIPVLFLPVIQVISFFYKVD